MQRFFKKRIMSKNNSGQIVDSPIFYQKSTFQTPNPSIHHQQIHNPSSTTHHHPIHNPSPTNPSIHNQPTHNPSIPKKKK